MLGGALRATAWRASPLLRVHPNITSALASRTPVVALESTIITHGLPWPENLQTAMEIEEAVRKEGAIPATTAFIDGLAHVGIEHSQLQRMAEMGLKAIKTSRRDIPSVIAAGHGTIGATTVSGTMILAHMAGIPIFGTGGIGGVHKGGENSMDVSADLTELSRTPVAIFCSGAKSILDIPRTLEYLETFGVSTHTFHPEGHFPAFYTAQSGCKVPVISSYKQAATLIHSNATMRMGSGMVFGVPIPLEYEEEGHALQKLVEQAVRESNEQGIDKRGKEATPWLLKRVSELSQGSSVKSNKALVINNAKVAARVARELQMLKSGSNASEKLYQGAEMQPAQVGWTSANQKMPLFIVGVAAVDITSRLDGRGPSEKEARQVKSTWRGSNQFSLGGVGRNVAESAHRLLAGNVKLISPVGNDFLGQYVRSKMAEGGLELVFLSTPSTRTASVNLQLDQSGDLVTGVVDMHDSLLDPRQVLEEISTAGQGARVVAFDGNISTEVMGAIMADVRSHTIFEPTSVAKSIKVIDAIASFGNKSNPIRPNVITPNEIEVQAMYHHARKKGLLEEASVGADMQYKMEAQSLQLEKSILHAAGELSKIGQGIVVLLKCGERGVVLVRPRQGFEHDCTAITYLPSFRVDKNKMVNTTGCGDTFAGAVAACLHVLTNEQAAVSRLPAFHSEEVWTRIITIAQRAASFTLQSNAAVSADLEMLSNDVDSLKAEEDESD